MKGMRGFQKGHPDYNKMIYKMIERKCLICGEIFFCKENSNKKYCTTTCSNRSSEKIAKVKESLKGHARTEEVKKILSEIQKTKIGSLAPNWQDGKSFEPYGIDFTKNLKHIVRCSEEYRCRLCGIFEEDCCEKLSVHHIDYDKKNNGHNNLIALCRSCHIKTNGKNREYWTNYFHESMIGYKFKNLTLHFMGVN